jgi:cob(I)alamin adenosyltransferase
MNDPGTAMKIYTRTGDQGTTSLLGGTRVAKNDPRIEAYGTVDELNSHTGLLRDLAAPHHGEALIAIQNTLFSIGSRLAATSEEEARKFHVPQVGDAEVAALEAGIDAMDAGLPPMRSFILPGGHPSVSQAHVCRTVCRRAERRVLDLGGDGEHATMVRYLNRLSDYFFVLARHLAKLHGAEERPWKPRG